MEVEDLKLFVDVARAGAFAQVARARNIDPSVISRTIAALENEVGARLFQRTTRKVTLTEAGQLFLARIAPAVDELEGARDDVRAIASGPAGVLRMTASNAFGPTCLAPILPGFHALHPQITVDLLLSDERLDLVAERIDLAIRLGRADDPTMTGVKLFDTRYRVCVSPDYQRRCAPLRTPSDLSKHRCLLFPFSGFRSQWLFRRVGRRGSQAIAVAGDLVTASALTLRACAVAAMGPALLPDWLVDADISTRRLVSVFADYHVTATSYETGAWIVLPSRTHLPARVKVMTNFLRAKLGKPAAKG
jgi:DNA-binding transcriptional LysR family regulator